MQENLIKFVIMKVLEFIFKALSVEEPKKEVKRRGRKKPALDKNSGK